jgi:transcription termination/antitermination protein NusG
MNVNDIAVHASSDASTSLGSSFSWYALRTRSNCEKIAAASLGARCFEQFLPLYHIPKRSLDRATENSIPLFPGYLFCRFDPSCRARILGAVGVVAIVAFGGKPAPIDDSEIEGIRRALGSGQEMEPYPYLHEGQQIRIEKGPLRGLEGILIKKEGWQIVISVQLLRRAVAVEIDPDIIAPIERHDTRLQTAGLVRGNSQSSYR